MKTAQISLDSKPKFCDSVDELLALSIVDFPGAISMGARSWLVMILSSLFGLVCPTLLRPAYAQEAPPAASSWWNPMTWGASSSDPSVRDSTYFNGEPEKAKSKSAAWSLPKLSWGAAENKPAATPTQPRGPSMFKKMGRSTRQAWNSTTDFLNPFNDTPAPPVNQGYQPQKLDKKTSSSGGGMFGWLKPTEPAEKPASVNDWLSQERPRF